MNMPKNVYRNKVFITGTALSLMFMFHACASLTLKQADFSWPVESVLPVAEDGFANEERHNIIFNAREMFLEETGDSSAYLNKEVRVIKDSKGYTFITSPDFKNVYVFKDGEGELCLEKKIEISKTENLKDPAFNQRMPYIELLDGDKKLLLTNEGIKEGNDEE
jgi:hypothetical protein